jgi:hypothetical protein
LGGERNEAHARLELDQRVAGAGDLEGSEEAGEILEGAELQVTDADLLRRAIEVAARDVGVARAIVAEQVADGGGPRPFCMYLMPSSV